MKEYVREKFKLNLIQFYLEEFLNKIQKPLGFFAEQTSESVHKNIKNEKCEKEGYVWKKLNNKLCVYN